MWKNIKASRKGLKNFLCKSWLDVLIPRLYAVYIEVIYLYGDVNNKDYNIHVFVLDVTTRWICCIQFLKNLLLCFSFILTFLSYYLIHSFHYCCILTAAVSLRILLFWTFVREKKVEKYNNFQKKDINFILLIS